METAIVVTTKEKDKARYPYNSENDNDDDGEDRSKNTWRKHKSEADPNTVKTKKQKKTKEINAALSERRNGLSNRSSMGTSHWLQNKDKVVLDDEGMILCDFVPVSNIFLHGDGEVSTQNNSVPFPQVQQNLQDEFY